MRLLTTTRSFVFSAVFAALIGALASTPALAQGRDPAAEKFAADTGAQLMDMIRKYQNSDDFNDQLQKFFLPRIDAKRTSRFVLGSHARNFSKPELQDWETAFVDYIAAVYGGRLRGYTDETFEVVNSQSKGRTSLVMTEIRFSQQGRPPLPLQWWLIKKDDGYLVFDLQVLGIWFAQEQRALFVSILNNNKGNNGLEVLKARLQTMLRMTDIARSRAQ